MPKGPQLTTELRVACVMMRFQGGLQHAKIAEELKLKPSTVRHTCARVHEAAGSSELLELIKHCSTHPRCGRPPQPGTKKRRSKKARESNSAAEPNIEEGVDSSPATSSAMASNGHSQVDMCEKDNYIPTGDVAALAFHLQHSNN